MEPNAPSTIEPPEVFNRVPYRPVKVRRRALPALPEAPPAPPASHLALASVVVPLASGVGLAIMLGRPQFLALALLAPLVLFAVSRVERRRGRRSHRAELRAHEAAVRDAIAEIRAACHAEADERRRAAPTLAELTVDVEARSARLWCRDRRAHDPLTLRVGRADVASFVTVGRGEPEPLVDAPAMLALDDHAVVGIHGDRATVAGLAASLVGQIAALHSPDDVVVVAAMPPAALAEFAWLRWLPHTQPASSPLASPSLVTWSEAIADLLVELTDVAVARPTGAWPRIVLIVHEGAAVDRVTLGRLLEVAPGAGVRVVWLGTDEALLPRQCRVTIDAQPGERASLMASVDVGLDDVRFTAEVADGPQQVDALARALEPLRDATSAARAASLARTVGLADVVWASDRADVATRWTASTGASLAAPIGLGVDGPVWVDLVAHGPHALIAGTSGAGKSELLQTMVASMAAHHPPERLTFLFIDYKGGAAAAAFAGLPHLVGSVSNLDPRLSRRALVSLRAELDRRMRHVADVGGTDVTDLPRLVIVIDEFATLVKAIPDFITGIVDIAQRGRSLGIHLVLATQRPAGAVSENILANTNLRICLRVVDGTDSHNVIGVADAAEIPATRRGRAFARFGPGDLVPFQVAWAGAPCRPARAPQVVVEPLAFETRLAVGPEEGSGGEQLDVILSDIRRAHRGPAPRQPWLPPLPDVVDLASLARPATGRDHQVTIGLHDDPARQRRGPAVVDLDAEGGLLVFGTGGSGRSTVLRTAVASMDDVEVMVFDFASRGLLSLRDVAAVRGVHTPDDLESAAYAIEGLTAALVHRRQQAGPHRRIVVLIDGYGALRAELDHPAGYDWLQQLQRVIVEGRQVGIHAIIATDRRADVPNAILGAISARLVLRMADADDAIGLGVPAAIARDDELPPGRGHLRGDQEVQVAVLGDDPSLEAQVRAVQTLDFGPPVRRDAAMPVSVGSTGDPDVIGVGRDGAPVTLPFPRGHLLIVGPPGSGRSTALAAVLAGRGGEVHVVSGADDLTPDLTGVIAIDDADRIDDPRFGPALERLLANAAVQVIATADSAVAARSFVGWMPVIRRSRQMLLLQPNDAGEIDQLTGVRLRFRPGAAFPPGRGVLVAGRQATLVHIKS